MDLGQAGKKILYSTLYFYTVAYTFFPYPTVGRQPWKLLCKLPSIEAFYHHQLALFLLLMLYDLFISMSYVFNMFSIIKI
jgi:hypothetical protein